jgi:hypothetical protein
VVGGGGMAAPMGRVPMGGRGEGCCGAGVRWLRGRAPRGPSASTSQSGGGEPLCRRIWKIRLSGSPAVARRAYATLAAARRRSLRDAEEVRGGHGWVWRLEGTMSGGALCAGGHGGSPWVVGCVQGSGMGGKECGWSALCGRVACGLVGWAEGVWAWLLHGGKVSRSPGSAVPGSRGRLGAVGAALWVVVVGCRWCVGAARGPWCACCGGRAAGVGVVAAIVVVAVGEDQACGPHEEGLGLQWSWYDGRGPVGNR